MDNNYRCYHFANMYLPSIHAGVQSQHCLAEMMVKYNKPNTIFFNEEDGLPTNILFTWASRDKTTIVLNGGMSGDLQNIVELLSMEANPYPWGFFKESEYALNGALTNVGIILPEKVYTYDKLVTSKEEFGCGIIPKLTTFEMLLVEALRGKRLMN